MDTKLKNKWIKALTSGKYTQGLGYLKQRNVSGKRYNYCCLGVLGEVAGLKETDDGYGTYCFNGSDQAFEGKTLTTLGLSEGQQTELMQMNDGDGQTRKTFRKIADWIKKNV